MNLNKTFILIIGLFCLRTIGPATVYSQSTHPPGIEFDTLVYDFGILEKGADAECRFTFTNNQDKPLLITGVKASCGCTVPQWPREPVAPGQTGVISVKYNTGSTGVFSKTIQVNTSLDNRTIILTVKGEVRKKGG